LLKDPQTGYWRFSHQVEQYHTNLMLKIGIDMTKGILKDMDSMIEQMNQVEALNQILREEEKKKDDLIKDIIKIKMKEKKKKYRLKNIRQDDLEMVQKNYHDNVPKNFNRYINQQGFFSKEQYYSDFLSSVSKGPEDTLDLKFNSLYKGQYLEPYHVFLKKVEKEGKSILQIHRHTIPYFIPVAQLFLEFGYNLKHFSHQLFRHLHSYIMRRGQFLELFHEAKDEKILKISNTDCYQQILIQTTEYGNITLSITYPPLDFLPSDIKFITKEDMMDIELLDKQKDIENTFKTNYLRDSFYEYFS